jgi:ubiquinol-cytochrome c reductase cytochrome b subunit
MSLLPFPSFLDDVQEKGWRKAIMEGVDESVTRLTAGMNIQDIREALRGEEASRRPNPRLSPHADGFWLHMRPGYFHKDMTGTYPTFRLGWLSTYFVFFETITGALLMFWYTPAPDIAYGDMLKLLGNIPLGQFLRDLHRLGAEGMVLIVALHMMRTWITGSYKKPRQFTWFTGVLLLVFTGLLSFTGYLLPWDQLALWAVTIGASMAEATPVIGAEVNLIVRGAPELGANGLLRFYLLHVLGLPIFLFIFTGVHYYKVIIHGHSLPPQKENIGEDTAKRVPLDKRVYYIPDILTNELVWTGVTTFILIILCIWFYHAPLENHANPQATPLGTTAPWYFLWIQGALKLGDKFFWGILFPTVVIIVFCAMPYLDVTPSRRVMLSWAMATISIMTILSYMGLPEFAVSTAAETEILHHLTFEPAHSHVGIARTIPFNELIPGAYTTAQFEGDDPTIAVRAFEEEINAEANVYHEVAVTTSNPLGYEFVTPFEQMAKDLTSPLIGHLDPARMPTNFTVVTDSTPVLLEVLEELHHELEANHLELDDAWGALIVSENQDGLRRLDIVISWDGVQIVNGRAALDEEGEPLPLYVEDTNAAQIENEAGELVYPPLTIVNAEGETVPVQQRRLAVSHLYLHEDSAYFD